MKLRWLPWVVLGSMLIGPALHSAIIDYRSRAQKPSARETAERQEQEAVWKSAVDEAIQAGDKDDRAIAQMMAKAQAHRETHAPGSEEQFTAVIQEFLTSKPQPIDIYRQNVARIEQQAGTDKWYGIRLDIERQKLEISESKRTTLRAMVGWDRAPGRTDRFGVGAYQEISLQR
jgi:hypothetical protein